MEQILHAVYKITNEINGKIYIGKHSGADPKGDSYYGSGIAIKRAITKYGRDHFAKEVLFLFESEQEALDMEADIVDKEFVKRTDTYNISLGGNTAGRTYNPNTAAQKGEANWAAQNREFFMGKNNPYFKQTPEQKERSRQRFIRDVAVEGKPNSEQHNKNIGNAKVGSKNPRYGAGNWYVIEDPEGNIHYVKGIRRWAIERNLDRSTINRVCKGSVKATKHKGYTPRYATEQERITIADSVWDSTIGNTTTQLEREKVRPAYIIEDDTGAYFIQHMTQFCKENDYSVASFTDLANGRRKQVCTYKGYTCRFATPEEIAEYSE
jgi:hypothetical protein